MSEDGTPESEVQPALPHRTGHRHTIPALTAQQRAMLAQRLARPAAGADTGGTLPLTAAALAVGEGSDSGAARLEALVETLGSERVIVPVEVESDPRATGVHPGGEHAADFVSTGTEFGPALAVYSSAGALASDRPEARPMPFEIQKVALTALVETSGHVVVDPGSAAVVLPRPAVAALAQGDSWLPAWKDEQLRDELRVLSGARSATRTETDGSSEATASSIIDVRVAFDGGIGVRVELVVDADQRQGEGAARVRAEVARAAQALGASKRLAVAAEEIVVTPVWARVA